MIKKIFAVVLLTFMLLGLVQVNAQTTSASSWYNTRILDNSLNFKAEYSNWVVYTSWTAYNQNDGFKYYKVVRSTTVSDPIYPDNWYIKAESNLNNTNYTDKSPKSGTVYYRVCAITNEMNRYCSNVVKLYIEKDESAIVCTMEYAPVCWYKDWVKKTYSNKCMLLANKATYKYSGICEETSTTEVKNTYNLSSTLRIKSLNLINRFVWALESKWYSNNKKVDAINTITEKLNKLKAEKSQLGPIISYLVDLLAERKAKYENDFSEIEEIFNLY